MNHFDAATEKQLKMIRFLLNKLNIKDQYQRRNLVIALGNNTFKISEMSVGQANSVIWKLQYITARHETPTRTLESVQTAKDKA
jgi:hypothetical protein